MATKKSSNFWKMSEWHPSWRRFVIFASLSLNLAFIVILITFSTTTALDGEFMGIALDRYCSTDNDDKFQNEGAQVKALRAYVCDRSDAHTYFREGFHKYLNSLDIPYSSSSD